MHQTRRRLPHLDAIGQPQFITFRLHNSLPDHRVFPPSNLTSGQAFLAVDRLLDLARSGPTFLKQPSIAQLVQTSLKQGVALAHYVLHSWVIMPNHIHLLLTPQVILAKLLCSLKATTAQQANRILARGGVPFWQHESYDHLVRDESEATRIISYIEGNPVKAGLASKPEDYPWSSATSNRKSISLAG
jgi:REP element-mobilizing transposase RayT